MFEFKLPDIGEGVVEGEIVSWKVAVGQAVAEDEPLDHVLVQLAFEEDSIPPLAWGHFAGCGNIMTGCTPENAHSKAPFLDGRASLYPIKVLVDSAVTQTP